MVKRRKKHSSRDVDIPETPEEIVQIWKNQNLRRIEAKKKQKKLEND